MDFTAVILAGGDSRRMGRDKASLELQGESLLARQIRIVRAVGPAEIFISGRPGQDYSGLGCPVLFDREPGFGPLGGLERALHAAAAPFVLALAVDLPCMTTHFLRRLFAHCDRLTGAVPELTHGLEPLAAVYPKSCHAMALQSMNHGRHAARDFAEACLRAGGVRSFRVETSDVECFLNCNTPGDLAAVNSAPVQDHYRADH